jgi:hypothetical protein
MPQRQPNAAKAIVSRMPATRGGLREHPFGLDRLQPPP